MKKALFAMTPEAVIAEVEFSGLRGRGGGGFPAGRKWRQVAAHKEEPLKYIVCNGDEGDPGAFMDGSVMEGDPCRLIEGMMLAGYAVGASEGFIYVRAEYPLSVARLKQAIGADGGKRTAWRFHFRHWFFIPSAHQQRGRRVCMRGRQRPDRIY